jgi:dihydrofolate reductase
MAQPRRMATWWGPDGPTGEARLPVFVVTHAAPADPPEAGVSRFVTTGIEDALGEAREAAADKNVTVMGGAAVGNQYLRASLVDELSIHLVPVLFGDGTRLSEALPGDIQLESIEQLTGSSATHLRYRIIRA